MTSTAADPVARSSDVAVAVRRLSKTFGGFKALSNVDLTIHRGSVHGLMGGNGSGKSTLIKCLSGYQPPDSGGEIILRGKAYTNMQGTSGVAVVHQDLGLVPTLSVLENMALGRGFETGVAGNIRWRRFRKEAESQLESYGVRLPVSSLVGTLAPAQRAAIAIARALWERNGIDLLILDEPTASLPERERDQLLGVVRAVAANGAGILYVSHRIPEVLEVCTRISVLRDGRLVETNDRRDIDENRLINLMMGRDVATHHERASTPTKPTPAPRMEVRGLSGSTVIGVDLTLRAGEIVGLTGLLGAGQNEVGRLLFGADVSRSGEIRINGTRVKFSTPAAAVKAGVGYVPADRVRESCVPLMSVRENITLLSLRQTRLLAPISKRKERETTNTLLDKYDVRPRSSEKSISQLSGGNQQKAIVARWLETNPQILILDEPTQGVDVAARREILGFVEEAAARGAAVLLIDTDVDELIRRTDRVVVMAEGTVAGVVSGDTLARERILSLTHGLVEHAE